MANPTILLVSENFLRTTTQISDNLQSKFLIAAIKTAQEEHYQTIIGETLYNKLLNLVETGEISDPENIHYNNLLQKSQRFISFQAIVELCLISTVKIDNIGLNRTHDDKVDTLSLDDTFRMRAHYQNQADFYCKRLQMWLLDNRSNLPELTQNHLHKLKRQLHSAASCGVNLGGPRGKVLFPSIHHYIQKN